MIVKIVDAERFAFFESKDYSPVSAHRHGPESGKLACQLVQAKTRQSDILNCYGGVQDAQDQPEFFVVLWCNAGAAPGLKEFAQSLMSKTANHENRR